MSSIFSFVCFFLRKRRHQCKYVFLNKRQGTTTILNDEAISRLQSSLSTTFRISNHVFSSLPQDAATGLRKDLISVRTSLSPNGGHLDRCYRPS